MPPAVRPHPRYDRTDRRTGPRVRLVLAPANVQTPQSAKRKLYDLAEDWYIVCQRPRISKLNLFVLPCFHLPRENPPITGSMMQQNPAQTEGPFGGAPLSVQTAISFIMVSGILVVVDGLVLGLRTGAWKYLVAGFWYFVLTFWVIDRLIKLKPWAWWATVALSGLFSVRVGVVVIGWLTARQSPDPQALAFEALYGLSLGAILCELMLRGSREAFGIHLWRRSSASLSPGLQLDQVTVRIADKDLG